VERVRADARCVDETTIGMLFIRSGHDWMMKRCSRRRRKMVDDRSFFFFFCSVCLADADGPIFLTSLSLTLDGSGVQANSNGYDLFLFFRHADRRHLKNN
jgi:hypothetical protein